MHRQAMGLKPDNDYYLSRKVEFMKRIRNTQIANKIIRSNRFKDYTKYSLQACFARALELEGDFQVGEVVTPNYVQAQVLAVEGEGAVEVTVGDARSDAKPVDKPGDSITRDVQSKCLLEVWSSGTLCKRLPYSRPSADQSFG